MSGPTVFLDVDLSRVHRLTELPLTIPAAYADSQVTVYVHRVDKDGGETVDSIPIPYDVAVTITAELDR